jgi:signal transduction histidine kinase
MNLFKTALIILIISSGKISFAQQNGTLFLSAETLKKYQYPYEMDQYLNEHSHSERFSNSGWKYHPGDDLTWKDVSYNDSDWTILKTDFHLDGIPSGTWNGIGWFRLKLFIDSSLYNKVLAVVMTHYGASEIYLDGKLINQYGIPSKDPLAEKTFRPLFAQPVMMPLDNKPEHLLAVRYSFQNANTLFKKYGNVVWSVLEQNSSAGFMIHFGEPNDAIALYRNSLERNLLLAIITLCALLMIGSFHFFLYIFYSKDRFNLYMAIFCFVLAAHSFTMYFPSYAILELQPLIADHFINIFFGSLWLPVTMLAYYSLFYSKLPRYVWAYFIITPLIEYEWTFHHAFGNKLFFWITLLVFADMIRLFIKSALKKEQYVWIVGFGVLLSQSSLISIFAAFSSEAFNMFLTYTTFLAVPVSMSIFNALRTAKINLNLENQLVEVKRLSNIAIAQEQEKHQILTSQKETLEQQVTQRTAELQYSLNELKSTQAQLIQSEKMASLGELTAGIAHEIQNPLNFVNNFSDVNKEMLEELKAERLKPNTERDDELQNDLINDVIANEEKINYHGKRADAIVKGMLQHSRASTGKKEPTDINALCGEYLRLSYHGMRAKDKSFNAEFKTDFDDNIEKINAVPQDIGRVLLNLFNNAFYAVNERNRNPEGFQNPRGLQPYEPLVSVQTKKVNDKIEIIVKDNGNGIPKNIVDKIFQPFFTTKPTGQGTGLGLSLAYDIIKAHGGEIKVETKEGEGTEFIIHLTV